MYNRQKTEFHGISVFIPVWAIIAYYIDLNQFKILLYLETLL